MAFAAAATISFGGFANAGPITGIDVQSPGTGSFGINVISAACTSGSNGPATTIVGCLNVDHAAQVDLTSTTMITFAAGGQAKIVGDSGTFSDLTVELVGNTIDELILNIETNADGLVDFSANGGAFTSINWDLDGNGQNFFDITGIGGGFTTLTFTIHDMADAFKGNKDLGPGGVVDVKQIRLLPTGTVLCTEPPPICPGPENVPEPLTLSLFGAGLAASVALRRRRQTPD